MKNKLFRCKLPMDIQFFAEPGAGEGGTSGAGAGTPGNAQQAQPQNTGGVAPQIDYDKIAQLVAGKQAATEDSVIKGYLKQQGLTKEQMDQAIATFKEQQAANTPDINAIQTQLTQAQAAAQQANVEKEAMFLSGELGVELKTMPYVLKLADLSNVADDKGSINKETLKTALNKVLEELPQLKPETQNQQGGFRQIGAGGQGGTSNVDDHLSAIFGNKK